MARDSNPHFRFPLNEIPLCRYSEKGLALEPYRFLLIAEPACRNPDPSACPLRYFPTPRTAAVCGEDLLLSKISNLPASVDFGSIESLESRLLLSFAAHINFQPKSAPVPSGYIADIGGPYKARTKSLSFGWSQSNTQSTIDRNSKLSRDQRYDTFAALQQNKTALHWDIALPAGLYQVHIVAGDPADKGATYSIKAEGKQILTGASTAKTHWFEGTAIVSVTDGRLTISNGPKALRNKINFIDIQAVQDSHQTLQAEFADASSGTSISGGAVTSLDNNDWLRFSNVYFGNKPGVQSVYANLAVPVGSAPRYLEFHLDSVSGPLIGTLKTQATGSAGAFYTQHADIDGAIGLHDLYIVFKAGDDAGALDSIRFSDKPLTWIMPLGDSITEARGGYASYRYYLWQDLQNGGFSTDFVGGQTGVRKNSGDPLFWTFDQDHEGHSGFRADQILDNLDSWLEASPTDIVLLQAGFNDLQQGQSVDSTVAEMGQIIDKLRAHNAAVSILLSNLTPTTAISDATVRDYNTKLAALAQQKSSTQSRIILVDQYTGFSDTSDTFDGIHPNTTGEQKLAAKWFAALKAVL